MSEYRFSRRADADLIDIGVYDGLARRCDNIRPGYRRIEEGSHVMFFKFDAAGMLVVRVLHERMIPKRHITAQDEDESGLRQALPVPARTMKWTERAASSCRRLK